MMKLIFAQGNPGSQYRQTRHNVGWQVIDAFCSHHGVTFAAKPKFFCELAEYTGGSEKLLVAKPTTFYNETGRSLAALMQFYKLTGDDVLVLHDDLALPFGALRIRKGGSDAGNNGIKSVNTHGGQSTWRLRIGVATELRQRMGDVDFVLGRFSAGEQTALATTLIPEFLSVIEQFVVAGLEPTSRTPLDSTS